MIKEKEQQLFSEWKCEREYSSFIADGILNEKIWNEQSLKITFVLKEANWINGNVDLCEFLLSEPKGSYWKTWNNIARWSKALLDGGEYPQYVSKKDKTYWLSKVSFLNLKKVGGDSQAENRDIKNYAIMDAKFIYRQLCLYQPDIIICCGRGKGKNADILYNYILPPENLSPWQTPINGFNYFYTKFDGKEKNTPVISFYHPQRVAGHDVFKRWYEDMREMKNILIG